MPAAVLILGALSIATLLWRALTGRWSAERWSAGRWSPRKRRRKTESVLRQRDSEPRRAREVDVGQLAADLINDLAAIRGTCELAKMKGRDIALARRMDAAIETCTEAAARVRQLQVFDRERTSPPGSARS